MVQRNLYASYKVFSYFVIITLGVLIHIFYKASRIAESKSLNLVACVLICIRTLFSALELVFIFMSHNKNKW